jgi:hypothetical protein
MVLELIDMEDVVNFGTLWQLKFVSPGTHSLEDFEWTIPFGAKLTGILSAQHKFSVWHHFQINHVANIEGASCSILVCVFFHCLLSFSKVVLQGL